ncbi:MAG TPA: ice-binding family protein, partial [Thermoanaerobaculia bacterium]|nr:ice-binding family protein [Thermoanaerobaculia bacterium]
MKKTSTGLLAAIGIALLFPSVSATAQVNLGTAENFAVLAGSTVTNTGPSLISGEVGVSPGSSVTGFPPGIVVNGSIHAADAVAGQAQTDLTAAFNTAAGIACSQNLTGQNLGGLTLTPGVYCFDSSAALTGTLTLDLQGNPNAFFLFKIGSTLTTASGSSVVLTNSGGTGCPPNVFFQVGSSATFGTGSTFVGNVLALTSITATTGAQVNGRLLARNGAVTLDTNNVTSCAAAAPPCDPITVNPASLPPGTVGSTFNQTITASGSPGPFTFTVTSGALPNGLTLNQSTGVLSGVPTAAGTSNFTITATDAATCS